jgi:hypothetical protein
MNWPSFTQFHSRFTRGFSPDWAYTAIATHSKSEPWNAAIDAGVVVHYNTVWHYSRLLSRVYGSEGSRFLPGAPLNQRLHYPITLFF